MSEEHFRAFVGVELNETVNWHFDQWLGHSELAAALAQTRPGARMIEARNRHLTLAFLGEIDTGEQHRVDEALLRARFC